MIPGIQQKASIMGANGCYVFALGIVAEDDWGARDLDMLRIFHTYTNITFPGPGGVSIPIIGPDGFVNDAARLFSSMVGLTSKDIMVLKAGDILGYPLPLAYICQPGESEILYFKRDGYKGGHFVVGNGHGHVRIDPWPDSLTVKYGRLQEKRIIRRV